MCIKCAHYFFDIVIDHFCRTYKPKTGLKDRFERLLNVCLSLFQLFPDFFKQKKYSLHWKFPEKYASDQWTIQVHAKKIYASPKYSIIKCNKKVKRLQLATFFLDKFLKCFECKCYLCKINACFVFFYFLSLWYIDIQSHVTQGHIHLIGSGDNLDRL